MDEAIDLNSYILNKVSLSKRPNLFSMCPAVSMVDSRIDSHILIGPDKRGLPFPFCLASSEECPQRSSQK